MEFTDQEKKFLSNLGRTEYGRDLLALFKRAKAHFSSIESIDGAADYGAQVEGRKLFITFVDAISTGIKTQDRPMQRRPPEDYD